MATKTKILLSTLFFVVISGWLFWKWQGYNNPSISTNKKDYGNGESLIVTIKNTLKESICFSCCYPYYLEKNNGQWTSYHYGECEKEDVNEICVEQGQIKSFEIDLVFLEEGIHRLALPACSGCIIGEEFKEIKRFYSNEFSVRAE